MYIRRSFLGIDVIRTCLAIWFVLEKYVFVWESEMFSVSLACSVRQAASSRFVLQQWDSGHPLQGEYCDLSLPRQYAVASLMAT